MIFAKFPSRGGPGFFKGDLHIGLTSKLVSQNLFGFDGRATRFDLGLKYSHYSGVFDLGFSWRDLNRSTISYGSNVLGDQIPSTGILGFSLKPPVGVLHGLLLSFDYGVIKPAARKRDFMFGVEYDLSRINVQLPIKLRLGANSNHEIITFGINFSPEVILGQDWIPSGDYAFASGRGSFDAAGGRFSISVDRNPFTAKYWYERAILELPELESGQVFNNQNFNSHVYFSLFPYTDNATDMPTNLSATPSARSERLIFYHLIIGPNRLMF